ncbi:type I-C CRISPR-associated protein Cas8c/Csd1 [Amaricoccus sp.]|uniref:type I-C CRISPR-associated protein Cas8c/Csd1 n=1 Tax=Amaricoccus sp. TaxID=1872485 RepID=UPI001B410115|nr:type I-C CRISPR-associated protein Cas8c/Csd1 [Amaricoccus sp.]MBP7003411.1 type I-C CRISPR-associated protein Cas8c/Csd1 [Amaricoccus sp.]
MSVLAALARAYGRLDGAPPFGFSTEKVGFIVTLRADGAPAHAVDLRRDDRKRTPAAVLVPQAVKRTVGIAPNFLWDKTAYALGVTAGEGKRTAQEHEAFKERHRAWLDGTEDPGLRAFLGFLDRWTPGDFAALGWDESLRDANVVFALESEWEDALLHDRPAARAAWARKAGAEASDPKICLVSGEPGPVARLHPSIKGVWGAQTAGASLVSYNLDAFTSYEHEQGDNAQVSEAAAFAYTTALNIFLDRESGHRLQIGDASTVFWAESGDREAARTAEDMFAVLFGGESRGDDAKAVAGEDAAQARRVGARLAAIREGRPLAEIDPALAEGVRFFVLGLAPNAARLSVRFYVEDSFGEIARRYRRFLEDMAIEPPPPGQPGLWRWLVELAVQGKRENVPPNIAGDWMRAILTGAPYPRTLLSAALMRARADQSVNVFRAAMMKAVLVRNSRQEVPVSLDEDNPNAAYQLGRLFAVMEGAQYAALGRVNAPIGDRYYAAASSTPARVFATLLRGLKVHIADIRKQEPSAGVPGRGLSGWFDKRVAAIMERLPADLPKTLRLEDQARFAIGYYHEKARRHSSSKADTDASEGDDA